MKQKMQDWVKKTSRSGRDLSRSLCGAVVGAVEKGFAKLAVGRISLHSAVDLGAVPKYVTYRAALIREKLLLQYACLGLAALLVAIFAISRVEVARLSEKLRTKEFILAPGVNDFVPVAPQTVPDAYVTHAVSDIIATLGNTNPVNIEMRYQQLEALMSPSLQIAFHAESQPWVQKARADNISEMTTVLEQKIVTVGDGTYKVTAHTKTEAFVGSESIGFRSEVVELGLHLVAPDVGRRWYLEITSLARSSAEAFTTGERLGGKTHE